MARLKPCMKCPSDRVAFDRDVDADGFGRYLFVKCLDCGVRSRPKFVVEEEPQDYQEVADDWNDRPLDKPAGGDDLFHAGCIVEAICADMTHKSWRTAENRDQVLSRISELRALLSAVKPTGGGVPDTFDQLPDEAKDQVYEAVSGALGEAYDCVRVWSAWSYGTMGPSDFVLVGEDGERVNEIASAAIDALIATQQPPEGEGSQ